VTPPEASNGFPELGTAKAEEVRARVRAREATGLRTFYTPNPVVWERTENSRVWDADGNSYVDLHAGFAVAAVGYCHPRVTDAITRQAATMTHCPTAAPSEVRATFYEGLATLMPDELTRFIPTSTGAFANELAVGLARGITGRQQVVAFSGGFVGRTRGTVGYAGKQAYRERLGLPADAHFFPYPDPYRSPWAGSRDPADAVIALFETMLHDPASGLDRVACVIVESIQGNGGIVIPPESFLPELRRLCDEAGAMLIIDDIQAGFGRAGTTWSWEPSGIVPDIATIGKGLGGGLPVAAVVGREEIMTRLPDDSIAGTFIANALSLTAATEAIRVFRDEGLAARSAQLGDAILRQAKDRLDDCGVVGDIRGRGLFMGIEIVKDRASGEPASDLAGELALEMRRRGVIVGRSGRYSNVIKASPPLTIPEAELTEAMDHVIDVIASTNTSGAPQPQAEALHG
jgi:4-aminobutyrate aminotransferase-like enzyme